MEAMIWSADGGFWRKSVKSLMGKRRVIVNETKQVLPVNLRACVC